MKLFQRMKENWIKKIENRFEKELEPQVKIIQEKIQANYSELEQLEINSNEKLASKKSEVISKQFEIEEMLKRVEDKKTELASVNHQLREQIRIVEAKGRPDQVWVTAFSSGFNKAWDMMAPLMTEGVLKMKKTIHDQAIDETLRNLETTIARRIDLAKKTSLRPVNDLLAKKNQLENRLKLTQDEDEKNAIQNYLEALEWALHGNNLQKN